MNQFQCTSVVLHFHDLRIVIVTHINFLWFPTAYLLVAFITNFLADQNVVSCVGGDLTFHLKNKTFDGHSFWNMNLNGIINICTDR